MARRLIFIMLCVGIMGANITACFADDKHQEIEIRVQLLIQGLDLTSEQADRIRDILADAQKKNAAEQNKTHSSIPNLSEKEIYEETNNEISAVLTIEQRDKFKEFSTRSPHKKNLLELKQRLSLNEEQTESIEILMISKASEMEKLKNSSESKDPRQYHQSMKKLMDAQAKLIEKLLTKEQKKEFKALRREHEKKRKEKGPQR